MSYSGTASICTDGVFSFEEKLGHRQYSIDPYVAILKQSERKAVAYGLIAALTLVIAFVVADLPGEGAGQFAPMVEQVRYTVGLGFLCACGASGLLSLWFIGRYAYFIKWPERFE
jgi:hypothetical protein